MPLNLRDLKEMLWMIPLDEVCGMVVCRIIKENANIRCANQGFRNAIEALSAHLPEESAAADANAIRNLADRVEHRALKKSVTCQEK